MHGITTGDGLRSFMLGRAYATTKQRIQTLSQEAVTGQKADPALALKGQTQGLSGLNHQLQLLDSYHQNIVETSTRLDAIQAALSDMNSVASGFGMNLLGPGTQSVISLNTILAEASSNLDRVVSAINTNTAGTFVFSGNMPDSPAILSSTQLLDTVLPIVSGLSSAEDVANAIDAFFAAPEGGGGYLDLILTGSAEASGPVAISASEKVNIGLTAANDSLRQLLAGTVLAALADAGTPPVGDAEKMTLASLAGERLIDASAGIVSLQARTGVTEGQVERNRLRNEAETNSLQKALGVLLSADPYEASVALNDEQARLEMIYALTARLSRMTLTDRL